MSVWNQYRKTSGGKHICWNIEILRPVFPSSKKDPQIFSMIFFLLCHTLSLIISFINDFIYSGNNEETLTGTSPVCDQENYNEIMWKGSLVDKYDKTYISKQVWNEVMKLWRHVEKRKREIKKKSKEKEKKKEMAKRKKEREEWKTKERQTEKDT